MALLSLVYQRLWNCLTRSSCVLQMTGTISHLVTWLNRDGSTKAMERLNCSFWFVNRFSRDGQITYTQTDDGNPSTKYRESTRCQGLRDERYLGTPSYQGRPMENVRRRLLTIFQIIFIDYIFSVSAERTMSSFWHQERRQSLHLWKIRSCHPPWLMVSSCSGDKGTKLGCSLSLEHLRM